MHSPLRTRRSVGLPGLIVALVLVAVACGGDGTTTQTRGETTTTTATATTVATTASRIDSNSLASASGCMPGTAELQDGMWFGYVAAVADTEFEFDLACWFTGDAAVMASDEDGEESPPPNDYYVRNVIDQLRTIPVAAEAEVTWLPNVGDPSSEATVAYSEWLLGRDQRGVELQLGIWLIIEGGEAISIAEQYVP